MRLNVLFQEQNDTIKFNAVCPVDYYNVDFGEIQTITENDYNKLENKPIINSVVLQGALTAEDLGLGRVYYDSKENWDLQRELIAEKGVVYIYSDYTFIEDESSNRTEIAGIKIGDGTSYLIDMPFISDAATYLITKHVSNAAAHVSSADREFWNSKVSAYTDHGGELENLILSKDSYELNGEIINRQ